MVVVLDAVQVGADPAGIELGEQALQPDAARPLRLERPVHGHRRVEELQLRRDDRDFNAIARESAQRQQRLQPGDARTGNEHARTAGLAGCALGEAWSHPLFVSPARDFLHRR
jgi:hypothetical protein